MAIDELALGMFVHPLSRANFLLTHPADLRALKDSGVRGMFVDLSRSRITPSRRSPPGPAAPEPAVKPAPHATQPVEAPRPHAPASGTAADFTAALNTLESVKRPVENLLNEARLGRALSNDSVRSIVSQITSSVELSASAIISLSRIRTKDRFTYAHSVAVCALMANLARRLGLDAGSQQELAVGGLLHDVGKMSIPDHVLNKPGRLTDTEMDVMRSHVLHGHDLLKRTQNVPAVALDICLHHHEKVDGTGYPHKLAGEAISEPARMAAICDVYDAITSNRPYKEAWGPAETLAGMFSWVGHFDQKLLSIFIKSVGIYPVGSLVRMASNHLAVVIAQDEDNLTRPTVRLFYSIPLRERVAFRDVVLTGEDDAVVSREEPKRWGFMEWDNQWPRMLTS